MPRPTVPQQQEQLKLQIQQLRMKALLMLPANQSGSVEPKESLKRRGSPLLDQERCGWSEYESDNVNDNHDDEDEFACNGPHGFKLPKLMHPVLTRQHATVSVRQELRSSPLRIGQRLLTKPSRVLPCTLFRAASHRFVQ